MLCPGDRRLLEKELQEFVGDFTRQLLAAFTITSKISRNDGEVPRQSRGDFSPFEMGLRPTMQQQQRRPASANDTIDCRFGCFNSNGLEPGEIHARSILY